MKDQERSDYHSGQNLMLILNKIKVTGVSKMVEAECKGKRSGRPSKFKAVQQFCSQPESVEKIETAPPRVPVLPRLPPRPRANQAVDLSQVDAAPRKDKKDETNGEEKRESATEETPSPEPSEVLKRLRAKSTLVPVGLHAILGQPCPALPRRPQRNSVDKEAKVDE